MHSLLPIVTSWLQFSSAIATAAWLEVALKVELVTGKQSSPRFKHFPGFGGALNILEPRRSKAFFGVTANNLLASKLSNFTCDLPLNIDANNLGRSPSSTWEPIGTMQSSFLTVVGFDVNSNDVEGEQVEQVAESLPLVVVVADDDLSDLSFLVVAVDDDKLVSLSIIMLCLSFEVVLFVVVVVLVKKR